MQKIFNVICVAMHSCTSGTRWSLVADEKIIFDTTDNTVTFVGTDVKRRVLKTGSGLDSMSFKITIQAPLQALNSWDIFTDEPTEGSNATTEEIHKKAIRVVENATKGG
jgi:hypothetical protein